MTPAPSAISTSQSLIPNDTATVTGLAPLNGTVRFRLFAPNNPTCATGAGNPAPVLTQANVALSGTVSGSTASTSNTKTLAQLLADAGLTISAEGTWHWLVDYRFDTNHSNSVSNCIEAFSLDNDTSTP